MNEAQKEFEKLALEAIYRIAIEFSIDPETAERLVVEHHWEPGLDLKQILSGTRSYVRYAKAEGLSAEEACALISTQWDKVT